MTVTFQTRVTLAPADMASFDAFADLFGRAERGLYAAYRRGGELDKLKPAMCRVFGLTARQFNAVSATLKGKLASRKAVNALALAEAERDLAAVTKRLAKLSKQKKALSDRQRKQWTGYRRREAVLKARIARLEEPLVSLCFGSHKLFREQFDILRGEADTVAAMFAFADWQERWAEARSNQFFLLGSKDETAGNQSCVATVNADRALTLRVRLPDALGKHVTVAGVHFAYGHDEVLATLAASQAISYRFQRDSKGWRVFASTTRLAAQPTANLQLGAVGVDVNAGHLSVTETDRFGNWVCAFDVPCLTYGKTQAQREAAIGDAVKAVVAFAKQVGKPIVAEKLDFTARKKELAGTDPRRARQLSSFAYMAIGEALASRALREGVALLRVNPAYTSVIGHAKYAARHGQTIHQAAAQVIARRGQGYRERAPARPVVPDGKSDSLTVSLPVWNRGMREWSHWARVRSTLKMTLAGWFKLKRSVSLERQRRQVRRTASGGRGSGPPSDRGVGASTLLAGVS